MKYKIGDYVVINYGYDIAIIIDINGEEYKCVSNDGYLYLKHDDILNYYDIFINEMVNKTECEESKHWILGYYEHKIDTIKVAFRYILNSINTELVTQRQISFNKIKGLERVKNDLIQDINELRCNFENIPLRKLKNIKTRVRDEIICSKYNYTNSNEIIGEISKLLDTKLDTLKSINEQKIIIDKVYYLFDAIDWEE